VAPGQRQCRKKAGSENDSQRPHRAEVGRLAVGNAKGEAKSAWRDEYSRGCGLLETTAEYQSARAQMEQRVTNAGEQHCSQCVPVEACDRHDRQQQPSAHGVAMQPPAISAGTE
jgi:hypothetical protein